MSKIRWFYLCFIIILVVAAGFAINTVTRNPKIVSAASASLVVSSAQQDVGQCLFTPDQLRSLHFVYFKDINVSMLATNSGPIGVDGGIITLGQCKLSR
jgi:hypothetical protein